MLVKVNKVEHCPRYWDNSLKHQSPTTQTQRGQCFLRQECTKYWAEFYKLDLNVGKERLVKQCSEKQIGHLPVWTGIATAFGAYPKHCLAFKYDNLSYSTKSFIRIYVWSTKRIKYALQMYAGPTKISMFWQPFKCLTSLLHLHHQWNIKYANSRPIGCQNILEDSL